ncbi:MAG: 5-formyltetrahydrofolate cyclo-ligase [Actinomycetaceae bacterium]|nr:5-formyltetrahydrofolate cyclo-ligase [Actinomycetaceae bacterium]
MNTNEVTLPEVAGLDVEDAKQVLRSAARQNRSRRPAHIRENLSEAWVQTAMDFLGDAQVIAAYVSVNDEPPTHRLCDAIIASGKKLLLPKLGPGLSREWGWYRGADDLEVLAPGRPPEPSGDSIDSSVLNGVDALLIPAILIGRGGRRIGQGGGWYDRILKQVRPGTKIGAMIYPDEYVKGELPQDDMDMRVPYIVLPDRWGTVA